MVIHLPGGKNIAVDAKVPFNSYLEASQIPVTATGRRGRQASAADQGARQGRPRHIDALGSKTYWEGLERRPSWSSPSSRASRWSRARWRPTRRIMDYAFGKRVALASPVTLWSVLKTVAFSWQQDVLTADAKVLFDLSRELYGRLSKLAEHVEKLGRSIERSVKDYNAFVGSLERQVLPSARKLSALDESKVLGTLARHRGVTAAS